MGKFSRALAPLLRDLAAHEDRVSALLRSRTPDQLNWRPDGRRWSILQCIEHLSLTNSMLAEAVSQALRRAPQEGDEADAIRPGFVWRFLLAQLEPPVRFRGFAPRILRPASALDPDDTGVRFGEVHDRLRSLAADLRNHDVNRLRFPHPVLRIPMSAGCAFLLVAGHERRHLWQAEGVYVALSLSPHP